MNIVFKNFDCIIHVSILIYNIYIAIGFSKCQNIQRGGLRGSIERDGLNEKKDPGCGIRFFLKPGVLLVFFRAC